MHGKDLVVRVRSELRRRFRLAGKGSVSRVQHQLGLGKRYFRNQWRKKRQRFDLRVLFDALDALEIDPAEFFATVLGSADAVSAFRIEAERLRRQRKRLPPILAREAARDPAAGRSSAGFHLAELDALRYDDPQAVMRRAKRLIAEVEERDVPLLLGTYASACRVGGRLDEAQMVLGRALKLAEDRGDDASTLADLIQRCGCIAADRGHFEVAYSLAEQATLVYSQCGNVLGVGKSLVDQGVWLFCLHQYQRALDAYQAALSFLGREGALEVKRNRVSCLMNCAIIHRITKNLDQAEYFAREARKDAGGVGWVLLGNILNFQALIAKDRGKYEEAALFFRESIETQADISPLDMAFSVVELCRLQLAQGRGSEAYETARILLPVLDRLEKNPLASSYVTELLRCAVAGRGMTTALLDRVAQGLRKGRRAQACHARQTAPIIHRARDTVRGGPWE